MWYAFWFFVILLLDQLSKAAAYAMFGHGIMLIPDIFGFEAIKLNTGISFGIFAGKEWAQPVLIALTGVALLVFLIVFLKMPKRKRFLRYSIIFIMTGAAGNLIDRCVEQGVRDFIFMNLGFTQFSNNVADLAVTAGVVMFILALLFVDEDAVFRFRKQKREEESAVQAAAEDLSARPAEPGHAQGGAAQGQSPSAGGDKGGRG